MRIILVFYIFAMNTFSASKENVYLNKVNNQFEIIEMELGKTKVFDKRIELAKKFEKEVQSLESIAEKDKQVSNSEFIQLSQVVTTLKRGNLRELNIENCLLSLDRIDSANDPTSTIAQLAPYVLRVKKIFKKICH
jgi:hypothetical protein